MSATGKGLSCCCFKSRREHCSTLFNGCPACESEYYEGWVTNVASMQEPVLVNGRCLAALFPLVCGRRSIEGIVDERVVVPIFQHRDDEAAAAFFGESAIRLCVVTDLSNCGREIVHNLINPSPPLLHQHRLAKADDCGLLRLDQ